MHTGGSAREIALMLNFVCGDKDAHISTSSPRRACFHSSSLKVSAKSCECSSTSSVWRGTSPKRSSKVCSPRYRDLLAQDGKDTRLTAECAAASEGGGVAQPPATA